MIHIAVLLLNSLSELHPFLFIDWARPKIDKQTASLRSRTVKTVITGTAPFSIMPFSTAQIDLLRFSARYSRQCGTAYLQAFTCGAIYEHNYKEALNLPRYNL